MRETRAVPVAQKFERKPSAIARKGLNHLQSFPRGMECIDPLGLGIIDNKTLRLITEYSESSPSKSDKDYLNSNLREKLVYFSETFDAKLFLSRIHQDTSGADLEAGALALKTDLKSRTQQKKQLVKENFDCFVSCKTTIDDIESKLKRIEEDPEGSGTAHLFNCMQGVSSLANRAFGSLFERQAQAEKIRSVQGMLQRFRTLFNLPSSIRGSISKGEYDLAVREYRKAKSIVLPSHVQKKLILHSIVWWTLIISSFNFSQTTSCFCYWGCLFTFMFTFNKLHPSSFHLSIAGVPKWNSIWLKCLYNMVPVSHKNSLTCSVHAMCYHFVRIVCCLLKWSN
ncbi:hypothetical protein CsSME_00035178 [Camellia sinensis var. sinensis]